MEQQENKSVGSLNYIGKYDFPCDYSYYLGKIYNTHDISLFEPELEFCESDAQQKMWLFLRLKISSFEYSGKIYGRVIKILIRDKNTKKYVGIVSLGSDVNCKITDDYIGWSDDEKFDQKKFNNLMNITTCVAIPPFSFNYNAGKLIAMLMFSKEVYKYFYKKYKEYLVCITTFSLYGKSIQYDRLKELKYVGLTHGTCASQYPVWLNKCVSTFLKQNDIKKVFKSRLYKFMYMVKHFKFPKSILTGISKGVYIGFTGEENTSRKYLNGISKNFKPSLMSVEEIGKFWKQRWAIGRFNNLIETKRIMLSCDYDTSIIDTKDYNRIKKLKTKKESENKKKLTNDEKIEIIKHYLNAKKKSLLNMQKIFTEKFDKNVNRKTISTLIFCV